MRTDTEVEGGVSCECTCVSNRKVETRLLLRDHWFGGKFGRPDERSTDCRAVGLDGRVQLSAVPLLPVLTTQYSRTVLTSARTSKNRTRVVTDLRS